MDDVFKGKCVSIELIGEKYNHDFIDPCFQKIGGRLFLVGEIPKGASSSGWSDGCQGAVAWELVSEYVVFDSLKGYRKSFKRAEKKKK